MSDEDPKLSRQGFLKAGLAAAALPAIVSVPAGLLGGAGVAQAVPGPQLTPTPHCLDEDDGPPTPPQMEGPYFKSNSPLRKSLLEPGTTGTRLVLSGSVFTTSGRPIAKAKLDFWQADARGAYDMRGFVMRGHQFTDDQGRFELTAIVAGLYPGRTRHIHVKVGAPNQTRILTTQLYFPNEPRNATDSLFNPVLLMKVQNVPPGRVAQFDFVLNLP